MLRALTMLIAIGIALAAPAAAAPDCQKTAANTTTCVTPGHTAITTTPNPALTNPGWGFGWGTPIFGLGGGGIWIGF